MIGIDNSIPSITLRPARVSQAPELQAMYESASDYFHTATGLAATPGQARSDLVEVAGDDARHILAIYLQDELIGVLDFKLAEPGPFDARLGLLLLGEGHRGQGLGSWALRIWEEWLRRATPTEAVVLTVLAQNHAAQRFFQRHGYSYTGQAIRIKVGDVRSRLLFMRKAV